MESKIIDKRYRYSGIKNYVKMSKESLSSRDNFIRQNCRENVLEKQNCYVCKNTSFDIINEVDRYGFYYPTGICGKCGNVQQSEYYKTDVIIDFYSNYYRKIYGEYDPKEFYLIQRLKKGPRIFNFVKDIIKPKKVLDVGCGAGGIISVFKDKGCEVLGIDFDEKFLECAKNFKIPVLRGSINQLDENKKFDLIILNHVLEHIVYPVEFLEKVLKYLNPNGILYIEVPSLEHVRNGGYKYDLLLYWQNAHTIHFNNQTLALVCKRAGLEAVKKTSFIHSCWVLSNSDKKLSDTEKQKSLAYTKNLILSIERNRKNWFCIFKNFLLNNLKKLLDIFGLKKLFRKLYKKLI